MHAKQWSAGLMSALLVCTGAAIMVVNAASHLGLSERNLLSWFFICYTVGGALNLILAWRFRMPIAGAHSVTSIAFLTTASVHLTAPQLAGSFVLSGLMLALLGMTGVFSWLFKHIPKHVIDATLAGLILHFIIELVPAFNANPIVGILAIAGYILIPRLIPSLPPIVGVIGFGLIGLAFTYTFPEAESIAYALPHWVMPEFTVTGLVSVALPIMILVLSNDIAVGLAALQKNGYEPPANRIITWSGIVAMLGGSGLGHSVNIGGMMTTMCSGEHAGEKNRRYYAALISSVICMLFGIFAWLIVPYIMILPSYFIATIIGYSLLGILLNSIRAAFGTQADRYATLIAFVISAAGITIFGVSAAMWSLVVGSLIAKFFPSMEKSDS